MTVIAGIAAGDMCGCLAHGGAAVMAAETGAEHVRMVHARYGIPTGGAMAALTGIGCLHVLRILAGCCNSIVAAGAVSSHIAVIEDC